MKIIPWCATLALLLSACEGWPLNTIPYNPPTPEPSRTPSVLTATPFLSTVPPSTGTAAIVSPTATVIAVTPSESITPTVVSAGGALSAIVLGCDTSIDILHGMGEVTNAYVKITNSTVSDVPNLCATLKALDEGRPHPDKTECLPALAARYQVTFKLTVDSTYKQNTPVQVDITSDGRLLQRVGEAACTAIGVLPPDVDGLGTPMALPGSVTPVQP